MDARYIDVSKAVEVLNDAQVEYDEYYKGLGKAKSILLDMPIEVPEQKSGKMKRDLLEYIKKKKSRTIGRAETETCLIVTIEELNYLIDLIESHEESISYHTK